MYKIVNKLSGKQYIGVRKTKNLPNTDNYMGSGIAIKSAIKKYGIYNFEKIILETFETEQAMYNKESLVVDLRFILQEDTYNIALGGLGGDRWTNNPNRKEWSNKLSLANKTRYDNMTKDERKSIFGKQGTQNYFSEYNKTLTFEDRQRRAAKYIYSITSPTGELFTTASLNDFCNVHQLNRDTFMYFMGKGTIPKYTNTGIKNANNERRIATTGWAINKELIKGVI